MTKAQFIKSSKAVARANDDSNDPLEFIKAERNESGNWEAFYQDSKTVYFIDEEGAFNYASGR